MHKMIPSRANGCLKTCCGCGQPFVVRAGSAEAILAPDDQLYCYATGCADEPFTSHAPALDRAA